MLKSDVRSSPVAGTVDMTGADENFCGRQSLTLHERLTPWSGAGWRPRGSKCLRQMQAAARHVKGAGNQQGISGPEKFRQRETVQPVKAVAVKR